MRTVTPSPCALITYDRSFEKYAIVQLILCCRGSSSVSFLYIQYQILKYVHILFHFGIVFSCCAVSRSFPATKPRRTCLPALKGFWVYLNFFPGFLWGWSRVKKSKSTGVQMVTRPLFFSSNRSKENAA